MRRSTLMGLGFLFAGGLSCYDARSALGPEPQATRTVTTADACVPLDREGIEALVYAAFNEGSPGPSRTSLTGGNLNSLFSSTPGTPEASTAAAKVIQKIQQLASFPTRVTDAAKVTELINAVLCVAGFDLDVDGGDDVIVVDPSDQKQTFKNKDETFGFIVPPGGISGSEVIVIEKLNTAILNTPLDVHPLYFRLERSGTGNFPVAWVVSICPDGAPDEAYQYLAVGHQHNGVFKLLEKPAEDVALTCSTVGGASAARFTIEGGAAQNVTTFATRGPVSGSTGTFSTVGTVDRRGTTSGSTATFSRDGGARLNIIGTTSTCDGIVGEPVSTACRPSLTLTTPLGTPLTNLNVQFAVTAGGGKVSDGTGGTCSPNPPTAGSVTVPTTDPGAVATACWNFGTAGANTVIGTPEPLYDGMIFGYFDGNGVFVEKGPLEAGATTAQWGWTYQASPVVTFPSATSAWWVDQLVNVTCTYNGSGSPNPCNPLLLSSVNSLPSGFAGTLQLAQQLGVIFQATPNVVTPVAGSSQHSFVVRANYDRLCTVSKNAGVVTDPKLGESLCAKLLSAKASHLKGDTRGRDKALEGYIAQVQTQTGKHVVPAYASHLIRWADWCKSTGGGSCLATTLPTTSIGTAASLPGARETPRPRTSGPAMRQ